MDAFFQAYENGNAFIVWVAQYPVLVESVSADLSRVMSYESSEIAAQAASVTEAVAARDAAARLRAMAQDAGFAEAVAFFYREYECFCRVIARRVYGGGYGN